MHIERRVKVQLGVFSVVAVVAATVMAFGYANLPTVWFGLGRYTVTMQLRQAAGLYPRANVTYRGTEVGEVKDVTLTDTGVTALLSLDSDVDIPSDLDAEVHSVSAIGEQYVALFPRRADASPLRNGDVIPVDRTSVPPDINTLLDATNRGLEAIPQDDLRTAVDEAYTAVGGLGPDIARLIQASTTLARDGRTNLNALTSLVDQAAPVLNSQTDTAEPIHQWATQIADLTGQLQSSDSAVSDILRTGGPAANQATQLIDRLRPTLPILLANLTSVGQVALDYHAGLEQILVLIPGAPAGGQAGYLPNDTVPKQYRGGYMNLNLNVNLPPPCTTGYLPAAQRRAPSLVDDPPRPEGDLYCRVPVDSPFFVRGARNIPCATVPGKRAPTAAMCESDQQYVPLNDGTNWKGDPNATLSGQDVPQFPPQSAPDSAGRPAAIPAAPAAPIAAARYDPATGAYIGPDGKVYVQSDLARSANPQTWQSMLMPPGAG